MYPAQSRTKVLVVDDEPSILASISDFLESEFEVTTSTDPQHALNDLVDDDLSVILCDQRMPAMSGDEFLRQARKKSSATRVLLTGFADIEALGRAVNDGKINAYLNKPWDPASLRNTIRSAATEHRLQNDLRQERHLLRTLVDNIPEPVYVQDAEQRYTLVNRAFARFAGLNDCEAAIGKTEAECLPGSFGCIGAADGRKVLDTGCPIIDKCDRRENGREEAHWYSTTRVPIRNPVGHNIESLVGVTTDVTVQKQTEQHLRDAKEAAEKAVKAKDNFLARISHEIRTPLNSILGMAELLAESNLSVRQAKYVEVLRANDEMLLRLMSDLIDLTRGDLNELKLAVTEFNPYDAVKAIVTAAAIEGAAKGIDLQLRLGDKIPAKLMGDAARVKQVLSNLINNALKFTERGEVVVTVDASPVEDQAVLIEFAVRDSGIGIAAEHLEDIFEPFKQAEEFLTGKYGGSGLGLAICRQLVQQMGGKIWVESSPGIGSAFRFTVRFGLAGHQSSAVNVAKQVEIPQSFLTGLRVLLAEDNEDNVFLVKAYLDGVQMEIASNGREAVDDFIAGEFDVVLMDLRMPEMDGLEATRLIREWEHDHHKAPTPILAYTAHEDEEETSLEAGCTGHINKPASQQELVLALVRYATATA